MSPDEWAASGGVKVKRAKEHVRDLETRINTFMEPRPYTIIADEDTEPWLILYRVRIHRFPDLAWGALAGDILHNSRSALNILWRAFWHGSGRPADEGSEEFPLFGDSQKFEDCYAKLSRSKEAKAQARMHLLRATKPYKGGNDLLELLVYANDLDKHRLLIPAYLSVTDMAVKVGGFTPDDWMTQFPMYLRLGWSKPICPVEDGAIVWVNAGRDHPAHVYMDAQPALDVAFGEGEAIKGKPLIPTLHKIADMVDGIAQSFLEAPVW